MTGSSAAFLRVESERQYVPSDVTVIALGYRCKK
jgi:hypothetical protein